MPRILRRAMLFRRPEVPGIEKKTDWLAVHPMHGERRFFVSKESALRFPMGNRYPVLHLTPGLSRPERLPRTGDPGS